MTYPNDASEPAAPYGGAQYNPYPPARPTNVLAIVALVSSFFIPPAGIVCGHIALNQIKRTGENGRGLAIAGLIIGYVYTALIVLLLVFAVALPLLLLGTIGTAGIGYNY